MRKPVVDYRTFRLKKLNDPEFSHLKLLLGWVVYFAFYFLTENLIPLENCHVMHCRLDDLIPFREEFVIFYVGWYALIVFALGYFALYNTDGFRSLSKYIILTQAVAMTVYILYPSRQDLRPDVFPRENFLSSIVGLLYSFDTSTGVCPSLHVAYSLGIGTAFQKEENISPIWKGLLWVVVVLICLSTAFIKQHSMVDVFWGVMLGILAEAVVYRKYWMQRLRKVHVSHMG